MLSIITLILMYTTEKNFSCLVFLNSTWMPKNGPFSPSLLPVNLTQWEAQDNKRKFYFPMPNRASIHP